MKNIKNKFYIIILLFINLKINSAENDIVSSTVSIFKNIFTKDLTGLINTTSILGITSALKSNSKETFYGVALGAGATCTYYSLKYIPILLKERKIQKKFSEHINLEKKITNNENNKNGILLNFIEQEINNNTDFYKTVQNDKTLAFTNIYNDNIKNNNLNITYLNKTIDDRKKLLEEMPNNYNFSNLKFFYDEEYYKNIIKTLNVNYKLEIQIQEIKKNSNEKDNNNNNQNTSIQIINQQFNNFVPIKTEELDKNRNYVNSILNSLNIYKMKTEEINEQNKNIIDSSKIKD